MNDEEIVIPPTTMVIGGVHLKNIMSGDEEDHKVEDVNKKKIILLSDSDGQLVEHFYTAQAVCNSNPFREMVRQSMGQLIAMTFESIAYYGYITEYEIDDHEKTIQFSFTTVSFFPIPPEEPGFFTR